MNGFAPWRRRLFLCCLSRNVASQHNHLTSGNIRCLCIKRQQTSDASRNRTPKARKLGDDVDCPLMHQSVVNLFQSSALVSNIVTDDNTVRVQKGRNPNCSWPWCFLFFLFQSLFLLCLQHKGRFPLSPFGWIEHLLLFFFCFVLFCFVFLFLLFLFSFRLSLNYNSSDYYYYCYIYYCY